MDAPGTHDRLRIVIDRLLVLLFFIAISIPGGRLLTAPAPQISAAENRVLAPRPVWSWDHQEMASFPRAFERYLGDHFGFREQLIRGHHYLKAMVFGVSPVEKVLIGREGWLYFTVNDMVKDFQGQVPFSAAELAGIKNNLERRQATLSQLGIRYLLVLAPNKNSIYPEYLPDYLQERQGVTRLAQLVGSLRQGTTVPVLDLRPPLLAEKARLGKGALLYLTKDTHWNHRGAFTAYQAIMAAIRQWYPEAVGLTEEDLVQEIRPSVRGDLANMLALKDLLPEQAPFWSVRRARSQRDEEFGAFLGSFADRYPESYRLPFMTKGGATPRTVVVFRDSFFTDIAPFVSESFQHATYFYEPYNEQIMAQLLAANIKPDIVVEEIIERDL